ncbi:CopD family protein [Alphaproteobacteria bacterium]|nr:CopD family protein [Alphaproteobacteria bacterium]
MIVDIWTIVNPIIRTFIYLNALYSIGLILFKFHFQKYFNHEINSFCNKIIKNSAILGLLISILAFISIAGNLGGDLKSIFELELIELSFETIQGKSNLYLIVGFSFLSLSHYFPPLVFRAFNILGTILIIISFVVVGHSLSQGIFAQFLVLIHIICISFWLGSFLPLRYMCTIKNFTNLYFIANNFGRYAVVYIGILILTGLIFSYILLGGILPLITSTYGNVLLIKLFIVSMILIIGAINKFKIVPEIKKDLSTGQIKLKNSINIEIISSVLVLFTTSILTTSLPTPMGM